MAVLGALHEFMAQHRAEVLRVCYDKINALSPERAPAELGDAFGVMYDEIAGALRRDFEPSSSSRPESPLPDGNSDAALQFGTDRLNRGYSIGKALRHVTTISDAVGEVADRGDLAFTAREYQRFNVCLDVVASAAVQQYWDVERAGISPDASKRMGFLAHELRNAVSVARLAFDTIRSGEIGMHGRTAAMLDRSLVRLESLASQTLLAVHLHADVAREGTKIDVRKLLCELSDDAPQQRGIRVLVEATPGISIVADEHLLTSAVSNLLQNAIKFSHDGAVVRLRAVEADNHVIIEVEDECGGLPPGDHDELFRAHVQRGANRQGYGLGLAITREAIEAHGGSTTVRDLPGKGCVFSVTLPSRPSSTFADAPTHAANAQQQRSTH